MGVEGYLGKKNRNRRRTEILFVISLLLIAMFCLLIPGSRTPVLFDDSYSYMTLYQYVEGVMPVYPFFLQLNRWIFGEEIYLSAVVVEQALFAAVCLIVFVKMLKRQFSLNYLECYFLFLLSLLPFTTDMPDAMTTQEILTEGIAYAAFYLYMAAALKAVWTKRAGWLGWMLFINVWLAAIRSQLQILYAVTGLFFFYVVLAGEKRHRGFLWLRLLTGIMGCAVISLAGVYSTGKINAGYQKLITWNVCRYLEEHAEEMRIIDGERAKAQTDVEQQEDEEEEPVASVQYISLIYSRGMYEADYEDYALFEDERLRDLFLYLYEVADENRCRYAYETPGLWMWKDIAGGIGTGAALAHAAQDDYYREHEVTGSSSALVTVRNSNQLAIGLALVKKHFGRVVYHALMLMPQAFVSTVFFQIAPIYLLCHLVTLFLYLSAAGLTVWGFANKKVPRDCAEFMAAVLAANMVFVAVMSLVFFGQQRYLVYAFGIFYIAYYLLLRQLWLQYGLAYWEKRKKWIRKS